MILYAIMKEGEKAALRRFGEKASRVVGSYLEVGSAFGGSLLEVSATFPRVLVSVDPLNWDPIANGHDTGGRTLRECFDLNTKPIKHRLLTTGQTSAQAQAWWRDPIAMLFIDGGHTYSNVMEDAGFIRYVPPGGYVLFHDYRNGYPDVDTAIDELAARGDLEEIEIVDFTRIFKVK